MAKRKKSRTRRRFTGINALALAETYALSSIWTEQLFRVNPIEFMTGVVGGKYNPGRDGARVITLPELLGAGPGGFGGNYGGSGDFMSNVQSNLGGLEGVFMAGLKSAGVSFGFRAVKKLTSKPRRMINAQLRNIGAGDLVKV
jgi:hypothetical protein